MDKQELIQKYSKLLGNIEDYNDSWGVATICKNIIDDLKKLNEPKFCEIKTVYKKSNITEKYCNDCDGHCDCSDCEHKDNPYYTYETEVFDYNLCTSCNYRYGVFESTNKFCPSCGTKIIKSE